MTDQPQLPNLPNDRELGWRASRVMDSFGGDAMRVAMAYTHMQTLYKASQRALSQVIAENTANADQLDKLRQILAPFAEFAKALDGNAPDDAAVAKDYYWQGETPAEVQLTVGDFRRLVDAVKEG